MDNKFKVLTLDGGGVRGYLSAKILCNIEKLLNEEDGTNTNIGQRFDLIAGTSTGGIIALALGKGMSAKDIFELYETLIPKVFSTAKSKGLLDSKYSDEILKNELTSIFGDSTLEDLITHVCITSVSLQNASPRFHKTKYFDRNSTRCDEKLVDIALATSAAPTYFPTQNTKHSSSLIDGGICANNPSLIGLIDALELTDRNINNIRLLSIGTGEQCHMPYSLDKLNDAGKLQWIAQYKHTPLLSDMGSPLIETLMNSQSILTHHQVDFLLNFDDTKRYIRINPKLDIPMDLDDAKSIDNLKNLSDISKQLFVDISNALGD